MNDRTFGALVVAARCLLNERKPFTSVLFRLETLAGRSLEFFHQETVGSVHDRTSVSALPR